MLFWNGKSSIYALSFAIIASLYNLSVDPKSFYIEEKARFAEKSNVLFDYLVKSNHISKVSLLYLLKIIGF